MTTYRQKGISHIEVDLRSNHACRFESLLKIGSPVVLAIVGAASDVIFYKLSNGLPNFREDGSN